jgi:hypothetical protein
VAAAHRRSWWEFWNASTVDISEGAAGDALDGPLALLESNYFGSQYILQSAGRSMGKGNSGRVYPPLVGVSSLFGPFSTGDYIGWNGDVTLNYNAESPLYGAPSSNHAELALPYFDIVLSALPLARRRAARQPWPGGAHHGQSGLPGQQIDEYTIADEGGYKGVNYPGHIGPFGLHDWSDRGQRSNGAFAAVPFIEYYEHMRNTSWLRSTGSPFINEIASFYTDYMTKVEDHEEGGTGLVQGGSVRKGELGTRFIRKTLWFMVSSCPFLTESPCIIQRGWPGRGCWERCRRLVSPARSTRWAAQCPRAS